MILLLKKTKLTISTFSVFHAKFKCNLQLVHSVVAAPVEIPSARILIQGMLSCPE